MYGLTKEVAMPLITGAMLKAATLGLEDDEIEEFVTSEVELVIMDTY